MVHYLKWILIQVLLEMIECKKKSFETFYTHLIIKNHTIIFHKNLIAYIFKKPRLTNLYIESLSYSYKKIMTFKMSQNTPLPFWPKCYFEQHEYKMSYIHPILDFYINFFKFLFWLYLIYSKTLSILNNNCFNDY